jgi:hypothetical protein
MGTRLTGLDHRADGIAEGLELSDVEIQILIRAIEARCPDCGQLLIADVSLTRDGILLESLYPRLHRQLDEYLAGRRDVPLIYGDLVMLELALRIGQPSAASEALRMKLADILGKHLPTLKIKLSPIPEG